MSKLAVTITATILGAGSVLQAEAMTFGAAGMRAAIASVNPVESAAACGWYPSSYPQSWAVYTPGWGCTYTYPAYYYDSYLYRPYYRAYYRSSWHRGRPYWRAYEW
jgi:hypothetical protein